MGLTPNRGRLKAGPATPHTKGARPRGVIDLQEEIQTRNAMRRVRRAACAIFTSIDEAFVSPLNGAKTVIITFRSLALTEMYLFRSLLSKLGLTRVSAERHPIRVFLLEDDKRRHQWFATRFKGDVIDVADNVARARELLSSNNYDAIFLDHDLHPEHYGSSTLDDERTGYAIALWLASNPEQYVCRVLVHVPQRECRMVCMMHRSRAQGLQASKSQSKRCFTLSPC